MDFTPVAFSEVPNIKRTTTNGFELALSVLFLSGVQHYAETPQGMAKVPEYVKDIMRKVPVSWDESRFVDGYPGKLVVIARKANNTWYVAGINGEDKEKIIKVSLPFINQKQGMLITDGADNRSFTKSDIALTNNEIELNMKAKGGFVITFSLQ
jgi:hypothetical protein